MNERVFQLLGLAGFIAAGFVFIAVGVRASDPLTVIGSVIWILACLIWMVPLVRPGDRSQRRR